MLKQHLCPTVESRRICMNTQQLRYFLSVMDTGSFSAAGKQCFTSQSNISKSINNLENEFGYQLFQRTKEGVVPTREAVVLSGKIRSLVSELEAVCADPLKEEIQDFHIALSSNMSLQHIAPNFLKDIGESRQLQNIQFHFHYSEPGDIVKGLLENRYNLGFIYSPFIIKNRNLNRFPLTRSNQYIYYSTNHPLAHKENLTTQDFSSATLGIVSGGDWENTWSDLPFVPEKIIYADNLADLYLYIESGHCYAVLGPSQMLLQNNSIKRLTLETSKEVGTDLVWNKNHFNSVLQKTMNYLKDTVR